MRKFHPFNNFKLSDTAWSCSPVKHRPVTWKFNSAPEKTKLSLSVSWRHTETANVHLYSFSNSALNGGKWSASRPGHYTPGEKKVKLKTRLDWPQSRTGQIGGEKKSLAPAGVRIPDGPVRNVVTTPTALWFEFLLCEIGLWGPIHSASDYTANTTHWQYCT